MEPDAPLVMLTSSSEWFDFAVALHNYAMEVGLPDWRKTIQLDGEEWKKLMETDRAAEFKASFAETLRGVEKEKHLLKIFQTPISEMFPKYLNMRTLTQEPKALNYARIQVWTWMKACLQGTMYAYLAHGVDQFDVAGLFRGLKATAGRVDILTHAKAVVNYAGLQLNGTDIFAFLHDLNRAEARFKAQNDEMHEKVQVHFSDAFKKMKIFHAILQLPEYERLAKKYCDDQEAYAALSVRGLIDEIADVHVDTMRMRSLDAKMAKMVQMEARRTGRKSRKARQS